MTPNFAKKIGKKSIFSLVVPPPANRVLKLRLHRQHAESAPDSATPLFVHLRWIAMSVNGTANLYFLQPDTTMNDNKYPGLLKEYSMFTYDCNVFMHDGSQCHWTKLDKNCLQSKKMDALDWLGNSPDFNRLKIYGKWRRTNWQIRILPAWNHWREQ